MMDYDDSSSSSSSSNELEQVNPSSSLFSSLSSSHVPTPSTKRKAGRKKFKETRHPIFRGVRARNGGKWVCEVRKPNKKTRIWLGTYPTPEMAARAHDVAAIALRGKSAALNFEDSAWLFPRATSGSSEEIRRVASEAAERFRPAAAASPQKAENCDQNVIDSRHTIKEEEESDFVCLEEAGPGPARITSYNPMKTERVVRPVAVYVDEEAVYNMPGLLKEMAEGLMLTPPAMGGGFDWDNGGECHMDMSLWNN